VISFDCLKLPSGDDAPLKAVMVFIHGGGFSSGSGTGEYYGPDFFLNEDVVVVTLNYRLGALGKSREQGCHWRDLVM
jgi:carboxylesterase type B